MAHRLTHPSLLPAVLAQEIPRRPLSLGVHVQRIEIEDLVVTDHRLVLAHTRTAAPQDPDTEVVVIDGQGGSHFQRESDLPVRLDVGRPGVAELGLGVVRELVAPAQ